MKVERAIEILDPAHREHYDGMDEVNEACRMGMEALMRTGCYLLTVKHWVDGKPVAREAY